MITWALIVVGLAVGLWAAYGIVRWLLDAVGFFTFDSVEDMMREAIDWLRLPGAIIHRLLRRKK